MATATGANTNVYYCFEDVIGTINTTPVFKKLPFTNNSIELTKDLNESDRLGSIDVTCERHGNSNVAGSIDSTLSYGDFDDLMAAVFRGVWLEDDPVAGTDRLLPSDLRSGATVLNVYNDFSITDRYEYFTGCEVNEMNIDVTPGSDTTISFGMVGVDSPSTNTEVAGSTYVDHTDNCPITGFEAVIEENGVELAIVTQLSLTITNGITANFVVGSKTTGDKTSGKRRVTGNLTTQFNSPALKNKFKSETPSTLKLTLALLGNSYVIYLPVVKLNSGSSPVGTDGNLTLSSDFSTSFDDTVGGVAYIDRTPA